MTKRNLVLGSAIRGASLIMIVVTPAIAARVLQPPAVAQVMVAVAVATMLGVLSQAGLPWAVSFRVAEVRAGAASEQALSRDLRGASLYLIVLLACLGLLVTVPWGVDPGWLVPAGTRVLVLAVVVIGIARAASKVFSEVNKGFGEVNVAAVGSEFLGPGLGIIVVLGVVVAWPGSVSSASVVWALAGGWALAAGFAVWRSPVHPSVRPQVETPRSGRLRRDLMILGLISVLNVGIQQAHIVIAGFALDLHEAAAFSTAARLATLTGAPLMIIAGLASPDIGFALQSGDRSRMHDVQIRLQRLTGGFFMAGAFLCVVFLAVGAVLLRWLFGPAYAAGHAELVILSIGPLASLFAGVAGLTLTLAGERKRLLGLTIVGSAVALAGMVLGVSQAGGLGLAVGYSTGQVVINLLLLRSCRDTIGLTPVANPLSLVRRR